MKIRIQIVHRLSARAERKLVKTLLSDFQKVHGKIALLFRIAEAALNNPNGQVKEVLYPVAGDRYAKKPAQRIQVIWPRLSKTSS
ncbi:TPA: hypothetical protein I7784_21775 [Vibrio vulnificus]|nr:hypothetical protein [Vibrio vulnificus]